MGKQGVSLMRKKSLTDQTFLPLHSSLITQASSPLSSVTLQEELQWP